MTSSTATVASATPRLDAAIARLRALEQRSYVKWSKLKRARDDLHILENMKVQETERRKKAMLDVDKFFMERFWQLEAELGQGPFLIFWRGEKTHTHTTCE